ncbi:MAG: hypothetical protein ACPG4W_08635, partial [Flavobacteriales bacterium]
QIRTRKIGKDIHEGLSVRLNDPKVGFMSYVEVLKWVNETYSTDIKYNTLRNYMIDFFGTKIKRPRTSHIKTSE